MRLDGKYLAAFTVFDDIFEEQKDLIFKSGFVGCAVWVILSGNKFFEVLYILTLHSKNTIGH
jgi:hypothetical protein